MRVIENSVELIWITPDALSIIERSGRVCYKSENRINKDSARGFIRRIIDSGHDSVLEHASASLKIITDRGISHEIVRHRIGCSYSQESTRYCSYNNDKFGNQITVVKPCYLKGTAYDIWYEACKKSEEQYFDMLNEGVSPQIARSILPTCLKTELIMTANFRAWRHFLKLRLNKAAHPDIVILSKNILNILLKYAPVVFQDLEV